MSEPAESVEGQKPKVEHLRSVAAPPRSQDLQEDPLTAVPWAVSMERDAYVDRRTPAYIAGTGGLLTVAGGIGRLIGLGDAGGSAAADQQRGAAWFFVLVGVAILAYAFAPYLSARDAYRRRIAATASARVAKAIEDAVTQELDPKALFRLNRSQLDEYQGMTRRQQKSAFRMAQVASALAFAILIGGVAYAMNVQDEVDKWVTGGLTGPGSLLSTFLAATFFRLAQDASRQMNLYYLEPERTGRLIAVQRIADQLGAPTGDEVRREIIKSVLGWQVPGLEAAAPAPRGDSASPRTPGDEAPAGAEQEGGGRT